MLTARQTKGFRRDIKRLRKQGADIAKLEKIVERLMARQPLELRHRDHALSGDWVGFRDCHVQPDWLLLYKIEGQELLLARTGSHAELF